MNKIISIILWVLSLLCVYTIGYIGLGWFWPLGETTNYIQINSVFINLSYSYLAGLIFYILVSYFPYKLRQSKFTPVLKTKIDNLYNQINACVVTFHSDDSRDLIQKTTLDELISLISRNDMYSLSSYAVSVGYQMNNFQFLYNTRQNIFSLIESILLYKEFMSSDNVAHIEAIKDSSYFHLIKVYEQTPTAKLYYGSDLFKQELAKEIFEIINHIKVLKK